MVREGARVKRLLELAGLKLTLGDFVLGEIFLALAQGDYLVLLGPSGCGKTTLLRAIAGVYPVGPRRVFLDGDDVGRLAPHKRGVGYVAQSANLFPHMNVAQNIAFGLSYVGMSRQAKRERCGRIVDLLGVGDLLPRDPTTLSGGEGKRVALARSLVVNPRVLLLDEPLSGLHHNARIRMLQVLKMIHDELETATIHVTHNRDEAWGFGEHCAVMRAGKIEQVGPVSELFRKPATRFVAEFLGDANVFPARFEQRGGKHFADVGWAEFELSEPAIPGNGYLQIRPDSLAPASEGEGGALRGTVRSLADRGIYSEIHVEVSGGHALRVHLVAASAIGLRVGDEIALKFVTPPHAIGG